MWMHKESKWLVRGGRKVRCYLCGKKILKKDPFMFHENTGYYSHNFCIMEANTIDRNERRRAVKKIAVGAAVVGAMAAGAGKFIDISSQSKGSLNSPDTQTIISSQGLILPPLTSDPANPVAGQMWYRSDAGVTAHFDAVQNLVVYSSEINDGNVHVTSKGIINGLSVLPNDGTGWFGPDTTKGATAPGQYGAPYTETGGILEAWNYATTIATYAGSYIGSYIPPTIQLLSGLFKINANVNFTASKNMINCRLIGAGQGNTWLEIGNALSGEYAFTYDGNVFGAANLEFSHFTAYPEPNTSPVPNFLNCDFSSSTNPQGAIFTGVDFNLTEGFGGNAVVFNTVGQVFLTNPEIYGDAGINFNNLLGASVIGGNNGGTQNQWIVYNTPVFIMDGMGTGEGQPIIHLNTVKQAIIRDTAFEYLLIQGSCNTIMLSGTVKVGTQGSYRIDSTNTGITIDRLIVIVDDYIGTLSSFAYLNRDAITVDAFHVVGLSSKYTGLTTNTTSGSTAGTVIQQQVEYEKQYKKIICFFSDYENDTTTNQSIDFLNPFNTIANISTNTTGLTISATTSKITITSPDSTTTYSGIVVVEGY